MSFLIFIRLSLAAVPPTLDDLASSWINPNVAVSEHAQIDANNRDLAAINNYWGALGIVPQSVRPVDMFAINSLELPPMAACGADGGVTNTYGCGGLFVNGERVAASATRWLAYEAGRRSDAVAGVHVETAVRMPFEQSGVMWEVKITNPSTTASATVRLDIQLSAAAASYETVGTWVYAVPNLYEKFPYKIAAKGTLFAGAMVCGQGAGKPATGSACSQYVFSGAVQPDVVSAATGSATTPPNATFTALTVAPGAIVTVRVSLAIGADAASTSKAVGAFSGDAATWLSAWNDAAVKWEARWQNVFTPSNPFWSGSLPTLDFEASEGDNGGSAAADAAARVYYMSILTVVSQARTNLPIIHSIVFPNGNGNLGDFSANRYGGIGGSRSWWWDEGLVANLLALLEPAGRAPTLQVWLAHDDHPGTNFGHGMGNGYAMDCDPPSSSGPFGSNTCGTAPSPGIDAEAFAAARAEAGPEYGFYCYNPWAYYMALGNHARLNNASDFLAQHAANNTRGMDVEAALEAIVLDYKEYLMPGTNLVDYGPDMDGFSPTYKHVMAGCAQGNNVWMLRDWASHRESQGRVAEAKQLRADAAAIVKDTLTFAYEVQDGRGWFNIISPAPDATPGKPTTSVTSSQMRHVVDMFSVTFGFCGLSDQPCDLSPTQRTEIATWFREESLTKSWIRATSPYCNCSVTKVLAYPGGEEVPPSLSSSSSSNNDARAERDNASAPTTYPAASTCKALRPDHGSNGAYPSWPAFATEALCYLDGNCSSALKVLASFAPNTYEGPFGQAVGAPQLPTPPYTPFNDEMSYKPIAGVNRYIAIEGGSFFDAIVRGFFGYHPPLQWGSGDAQSALNAAIVGGGKPSQGSRGFKGTLRHLRTPHGLATITAGDDGLRITLE